MQKKLADAEAELASLKKKKNRILQDVRSNISKQRLLANALNKARTSENKYMEVARKRNSKKIERSQGKKMKINIPEECKEYSELNIFSSKEAGSRDRSINLGEERACEYGVEISKQEK